MRGQRSRRDQILDLLRTQRGGWVDHTDLAAVGGARYGARIMELRAQAFTIEQRGSGAQSQYRMVGGPIPSYPGLRCRCGWTGTEPQSMRNLDGPICPICNQTLQPMQTAQTVLL